MNLPRPTPRLRLLGLALLAALLPALSAQPARPPAHLDPVPLMPNPGLEIDADGDKWPDGWPTLSSGAAWLEEGGNRFIRLTALEPGKMLMLYREVRIPAGVEALELSWRQRVTGLKPGKQPWFDARIMLEFMDAQGGKVGPAPAAPFSRRDVPEWESRSIRFVVPAGAATLKFMPALFNVEAGTWDLDDILLRPTDPAPVLAAKAEADAARAAKRQAEAEGRQKRAAKLFEASGNLIANGDMERANKKGDWPADWPGLKPEEGSWETDTDGNRFLRMRAAQPDKQIMLFRNVSIPPDVEALELSWRWRVTGLRAGKMPWFDARIMMDVKNAANEKLRPAPPAPNRRGNTKDGGWESRSVSFLVPAGGVSLDLMPTLFQVQSGTFDLDDVVLRPTDPAPVLARQKEREAAAAKAFVAHEEPNPAKWPKEIRVVGNKILDSDDKEVWLQGLNVPSLEWSVAGEQVKKSTVVAIEEWKSNVIRLPVKEEYWFGRGPQTDGGKAYRELVDQLIVLAANRGAYVILDLHRYRAPKPEHLEFWTDAATRYKNHPALIFDLINEPFDTTWQVWRDGGFVGEKLTADQAAFLSEEEKKKTRGFQSPGMQAMLDTVRATGATNVVLVGGLDYAYQLDGILQGYGLEDKTGRGIIYASHVYPWKSGWQKYFLDAAAKHPVLLGEVGADAKKMDFIPHERQEDAETWVPAMLGAIQKYKLHWTGWCFHPTASPRMILDWDYTPTPFWGEPAKDALHGKQFPPPDRLR